MRNGVRLRFLVAGLLLGAGFYLWLIDTVDPPEVYAGLGVAALAAIAFEVSREQARAEASFSLAWLKGGRRLAAQIPLQIVLVSRDALAQLTHPRPGRGEFRTVSFRGGEADSARDTGRRALAEALGSLAPNTIVIGIDTDRDLLLVHQLHRHGGPEELDALGLG